MRDTSGFIKLHRKITDWEWYQDTNTVRLFLHILLFANYADSKFQGKLIQRGQLVTSLPSLSEETGLSIQQVRTATDHLIATGEITVNQQPRYRIITVVKYDQYQADNRVANSEVTGNQQASNRQATGNQQHNKNIRNKEYKEDKEKEDVPAAWRSLSPPPETGFDFFWMAYPKKVSKQDALKAWKSIHPDRETFEKIIEGLNRWINSDQWVRDDGRYIPYPASWLRAGMWWDDPQPYKPPAPAPRPQPRPSSAHNFEERDYSGESWGDMNDLAAEIARAKREGTI